MACLDHTDISKSERQSGHSLMRDDLTYLLQQAVVFSELLPCRIISVAPCAMDNAEAFIATLRMPRAGSRTDRRARGRRKGRSGTGNACRLAPSGPATPEASLPDAQCGRGPSCKRNDTPRRGSSCAKNADTGTSASRVRRCAGDLAP